MNLEQCLKIFIRFLYCEVDDWQLAEKEQIIYSDKAGYKYDLFEAELIAKKLLTSVSVIEKYEFEPNCIKLKQDADEVKISAYIVIDADGNMVSFAKLTEENKIDITNLPVGSYKVIVLDENNNAIRTEDLVI